MAIRSIMFKTPPIKRRLTAARNESKPTQGARKRKGAGALLIHVCIACTSMGMLHMHACRHACTRARKHARTLVPPCHQVSTYALSRHCCCSPPSVLRSVCFGWGLCWEIPWTRYNSKKIFHSEDGDANCFDHLPHRIVLAAAECWHTLHQERQAADYDKRQHKRSPQPC